MMTMTTAMTMKTKALTAEPQSRRAPQAEWNAADKGRKHEAFESGSFIVSEHRTMANVVRFDRKR